MSMYSSRRIKMYQNPQRSMDKSNITKMIGQSVVCTVSDSVKLFIMYYCFQYFSSYFYL